MSQLQAVAGYFRVSQARDDMRAPELYQAEIERYCAYKGLVLSEVFSDIDHSAFRGAKARPALERLKARRHEFSGVVVPKLSRFGRSVKDLVVLFELFDCDGIALVFLDMNLDTSTSQGRLLRHILAAFAEYESDVKSDYTRASQRLIASEGRPAGPLALYGYVLSGSKRERTYVVDPERAPIVREVFERYVAGYSLSRLARELNARGVRGVKGGAWSRQRLKTMLDNPAYAGLRRYHEEFFTANWTPLVSRELFERARATRIERRTYYGSPSGRPSYLLSGLIACGVCGANLTYHSSHDRRGYDCRGGQDQLRRCLGGQITGDIAEKLVCDAWIELQSLVSDRALAKRARELKERWLEGSMDARRELLREVIERVELVARPAGNRHGRGRRHGRQLRIHWDDAWGRAGFGYGGATSVISRSDPHVTSARGKSWKQWRQLRLMGPERIQRK